MENLYDLSGEVLGVYERESRSAENFVKKVQRKL
jgi:hypothetical protein